jgi:hypothetical protein
MADVQNIEELKSGVLAKNQTLKNESFKALLALASENPQKLYADWDFFADLIARERGADTKYIGIYILAHLTGADFDGKFERIFDVFYDLLDDDSLIPASHAALMSNLIANNLPHLVHRITERLLSIDATRHPARRKDLIKSYIIEGFDGYFDLVASPADRRRILLFVSRQQEAISPKTRKMAGAFINKRGTPS